MTILLFLMQQKLIYNRLKVLNGQIECRYDYQFVSEKEMDTKILFIQFQVISEENLQKFIRIYYDDKSSSEILLNYEEKGFWIDQQKISFLDLGIWQYVFIYTKNLNQYIQWYSHFKLIMNESINTQKKIINYDILSKEYIIADYISVYNISDFVQHCHKQQQITLRFDPQLGKMKFEDFNNNLIIISFWVNFKYLQGKNHLDLFILKNQQEINYVPILNYFYICMQSYQFEIVFFSNYVITQSAVEDAGWTLITVELNRIDKYLRHKILNKQQSIDKTYNIENTLQFYHKLQLQILKPRILLLVDIQLSFDYFDEFRCTPGCQICHVLTCLKCNQNLILNDGECSCKNDVFYSLNECYFPDIEYFYLPGIKDPDTGLNQQNCPEYDEQKCQDCLDQDKIWKQPICEYQLKAQQKSQYYEFFDDKVIFKVFYSQSENQYIVNQYLTIKQIDFLKNPSRFQFNSYVALHYSKYSFYQQGIYYNYNEKQIHCYEKYYGDQCENKIKNCLFQDAHKICKQCEEYYVNLITECKRCPKQCERCILTKSYQIRCVKCIKNYYVTLQNKCEKCQIENCNVCYQYNDDQISLQEWDFFSNDGRNLVGCAVCSQPYSLNLLTRACQLEKITQKDENQKFLCYSYQLVCLMCYGGYQLNNQLQCPGLQEAYKLQGSNQIYKQNTLFNNYWKYETISTFQFYKYDYNHIIKNQLTFSIKNCNFPFFDKTLYQFQCQEELNIPIKMIGLKRTDFQPILYTFIKFNILYNQRLLLLNDNNQLNVQNYSTFLLEDIKPSRQVIDMTIDENINMSYSDQQQLLGYYEFLRIKINYTFNNNECLSLHNDLLIIDQSYIKVGNFCLDIYSKLFELKNTIFESKSPNSLLRIDCNTNQYKINIQNVTFQNFSQVSQIQLQLQAKQIVIQQFSFLNVQSKILISCQAYSFQLSSLQIYNEIIQKSQFQLFVINQNFESSQYILFDISIINCRFDHGDQFFVFQKLNKLQFRNVLIQSSQFEQIILFQFAANKIQISNLTISNSSFQDESTFMIIESAGKVLLENITIINLLLLNTQYFIDIATPKGQCIINNLIIQNSNFSMSELGLAFQISTQNLYFNNIEIKNCTIYRTFFDIYFQHLANLSSIYIENMNSIQSILSQSLFHIVSDGKLILEYFSLIDSICENRIFEFQVNNISINMMNMINISYQGIYLQDFMQFVGYQVKIENLYMAYLITYNRKYVFQTSLYSVLSFQANQVYLNFIIMKTVNVSFPQLFKIKGKNVFITNFHIYEIELIDTIFIITAKTDAIIYNTSFIQTKINRFLFIEESKTLYINFLQFNLQNYHMNNLFSFKDCIEILLNNIRIQPFLLVQNLIYIESNFFSYIQFDFVAFNQTIVKNQILQQQLGYIIFNIKNCYFHLIPQNDQSDQQLSFHNDFLLIKNLTLRGIKTSMLSISGKVIIILDLTILNSLIDNINIDIQKMDDQKIGKLFISRFTVHSSQCLSKTALQTPFIQLKSQDINIFEQFKIINNNQNCNTDLISLYNKKVFYQDVIFMNNQCINNCEDSQTFNQGDDISQMESQINRNISIKINNNLFKKLILHLPTGQQLKDFKIFDQMTEQPYIQTLEIIEHRNQQQKRIIGNFKLKAYKYMVMDDIITNITKNIINFDNFQQTQDYNQLIELKLTHNPYQNDSYILLEITNQMDQTQKLRLLIKTFICQIGEIFKQDMCLQCDTNFQLYSLKQKSNLCSVFDSALASDFKHNSIKLKDGYWRPFIYSHIIEKCNERYDRCEGGWKTGNELCKIGYNGGICDSCDTNNIRGQGYYQMIDNECQLCNSETYYLNYQQQYFCNYKPLFQIPNHTITQVLKQLISLLKISSLKINFSQQFLDHKQIFNRYYIYSTLDLPSVISAILIQNISISQQILRNQEFNLPELLGIYTNPNQFLNKSTYCFNQYFDLEQYQINLITIFLFPFFIYNLFAILNYILHRNQIKKQQIFIYTLFNIFVLLGPTLIANFSINLFYVELSKQRYVLSDLGIRFFSKSHKQLITHFIIPILTLFGVVLPFLLFFQILQSSKRLFQKQIFQSFGTFMLQFNNKFEVVFNYYSTAILLSSFLNNQLRSMDVIYVILLICTLKQTYRIRIFNQILTYSWISIVFISYSTKFEQSIIYPFIIQLSISSFVILFVSYEYLKLFIRAHEQSILHYFQQTQRLRRYFQFKILYNEKQYWYFIHQVVRQHKYQFILQKESNEQLVSKTVLKQTRQIYQKFRTLETENVQNTVNKVQNQNNEGIEMQEI